MSDTAVTTTNVLKLVKSAASVLPTGQAVSTGNTAVLTPQPGQAPFTGASSVNPQFKGRYILVVMKETGSVSASTATFKAGVTGGTPANQAAKGDLTAITFSSGQSKVIKLELSRFQQADGTVRCDVAGTGGEVTFSVLNTESTLG